MSLFENITPDEEDRFLLNLSDGEPYFTLVSPETKLSVSYYDEVATSHTRTQINKIRQHGVQILSYFIEDGENINAELRKNFHIMYGKDAKFINVENIVDLAHTINGLFLK